MGLPGAVDYDAGRLLWAPHLPAQWPDMLSTDGLTEHLGLPVSIANDADLAAVGEAWFGAGAASHAVGFLTISTGIGAGVVHGGRLLRGPRSLAEVGHVVIDWRAWVDGAPSRSRNWDRGAASLGLRWKRGLGRSEPARSKRGGAEGEPRAVAYLATGHRGLRRRCVESRHVLLPEHRRHRRWYGPARRILRTAP